MTAPRWARRTSAVLAYVLFLLLILEAASRVALSNDRVFYRIKGWDEASSRLQWVRRHNAGERFGYKFASTTRPAAGRCGPGSATCRSSTAGS